MSLIRWEPLREMDEFFRPYLPMLSRTRRNGDVEWAPTSNVSETEKEYLIKAELPEVKREDVKVELSGGVLTISGERKHEKQSKDENELRVESFYGSFSRSFSLPDDIDAGAIKAECKDGVLKVHIPKKQPSQPKAIAIDVK
ncbi:MAG: Hsp20/alpha crystallin family protein [Gammaproteobacteria bacterium]|nr:Hsp20/alpha crystallin family protein [Gammaproteobacteria bacterium]